MESNQGNEIVLKQLLTRKAKREANPGEPPRPINYCEFERRLAIMNTVITFLKQEKGIIFTFNEIEAITSDLTTARALADHWDDNWPKYLTLRLLNERREADGEPIFTPDEYFQRLKALSDWPPNLVLIAHAKLQHGAPPVTFDTLPYEIKDNIFGQVIPKQSIQHVIAKKSTNMSITQAHWRVELKRCYGAKDDPSVHQMMKTFKTLNHQSASHVPRMTREMPVPYHKRIKGWKPTMDVSSGLLAVHFEADKITTNGSRRGGTYGTGNLNTKFSQLLAGCGPMLNRNEMRTKFAGIRHVGIVTGGSGRARDEDNPLRCARTPGDQNNNSPLPAGQCQENHPKSHANAPFCPDQLQGFLDLFPNLETVYIMPARPLNAVDLAPKAETPKKRIRKAAEIDWARKQGAPKNSYSYAAYALSKTAASDATSHQKPEVFYDRMQAWVEYSNDYHWEMLHKPNLRGKEIPEGVRKDYVILMNQLRRAFLEDTHDRQGRIGNAASRYMGMMPMYHHSLAQRQAIRIKLMLPAKPEEIYVDRK